MIYLDISLRFEIAKHIKVGDKLWTITKDTPYRVLNGTRIVYPEERKITQIQECGYGISFNARKFHFSSDQLLFTVFPSKELALYAYNEIKNNKNKKFHIGAWYIQEMIKNDRYHSPRERVIAVRDLDGTKVMAEILYDSEEEYFKNSHIRDIAFYSDEYMAFTLDRLVPTDDRYKFYEREIERMSNYGR